MSDTSFDEIIKELQKELEKKNKDLLLAAEIGQELLEQNENLKQMSYYDQYEALNIENEELKATNKSLNETIKSTADALQKQQQHSNELTEKVEVLLVENNKLLQDAKRSKVDKSTNEKLINSLTNQNQELNEKITALQNELKQLTLINLELENENNEVVSFSRQLTEEHEELKNHVACIESDLQLYQSCQETVRNQEFTIQELTMELEFIKDSNEKLKSRLTILEPELHSDHGNKTILSEIEDKRLELVRKHEELQRIHTGLTVTHNQSLYNQQKMKHHIARLSQQTLSNHIQDKVVVLEQSLQQCNSEKLELEKELEKYKRKQYFEYNNDSQTDEPILHYRIEQLMKECEGLKAANSTLRLIKNGESDKVHKANSLLLDKSREYDQLKSDYANLMYEFEELKLQIEQENKLGNQNENVVTVFEDESKIHTNTLEDAPKPRAKTLDSESKVQPRKILKPKNVSIKTSTVKVDRNEQQECKQQ